MKVLLVMRWTSTQEPQSLPDDFFKVVEMPCLPPIGAELWLKPDNPDDYFLCDSGFTVDAVRWEEDHPWWFEVCIEESFEDSVDRTQEMLEAAGWSQDKPARTK